MWKEHVIKNWKLYAIAVVLLVNVALSGTAYALFDSWQDTKEELRAANTVVQAKVDEIQEFNVDLGLAESDLRTQKDLSEKYIGEISRMDSKVQDLLGKYDLTIKEHEVTVAKLKNQIKGGKQRVTTVIEKPGEVNTVVRVDVREICSETLGYEWQDEHNRFHLKDPDIAESGNEVFDYQQFFTIKGYVFSDETGQVQIKKVQMVEVVPQEQSNGKVEYVPVSKDLQLVSSKFEYINKPEITKSWADIFGLRLLTSFDTNLYPGIGVEVLNFGRWMDWVNVGLYGKMAFNPMRLSQSSLGVGLAYHVIPPLLDTNFALGFSANTPFNDVGRIMLSADLIFYITNW